MHQNGQRTIVGSPRRPPGQAEGLPRRPICAAPKSCGYHSRLSGDTVTPVTPIPITTRCRKLQQQEAHGGHGPQLATSAGVGAGEPRRRGQGRAEKQQPRHTFPAPRGRNPQGRAGRTEMGNETSTLSVYVSIWLILISGAILLKATTRWPRGLNNEELDHEEQQPGRPVRGRRATSRPK